MAMIGMGVAKAPVSEYCAKLVCQGGMKVFYPNPSGLPEECGCTADTKSVMSYSKPPDSWTGYTPEQEALHGGGFGIPGAGVVIVGLALLLVLWSSIGKR